MSNLFETKKKCAVCGHEQVYMEVKSTNTFGGHIDLDTRPPEMKRSALIYEIQLCDKCSYSNGDISELIIGITADVLKAANYQVVATNSKIDRNAKAFLLAGHLYHLAGQYKIAGVYFLNAAWVFDDLGEKEYALRARNKAIENITKYVEDSADVEFGALTVDLYRRNGDFEEADETARQLLDYGVEDILSDILKLQIKLCKAKDDSCHTIGEAL